MNILQQNLNEKINAYSRELKHIKRQLNKMPEGKLICVHNKGYVKWFCSNGHESRYIPKGRREEAETLAYKKYLVLRQDYLEKQLILLKKSCEKCTAAEEKLTAFLTDPIYADLLKNSKSFYGVLDEDGSQWMTEKFATNENYPEYLTQPTVNGIKVRSKSESLIAVCLAGHSLPFRYECELQLGNITIYPDFTIRNPINGRIIYWEHFGMMDNEAYARDAVKKLHTYILNGIIPDIDLIITFEDAAHPLTYEKIENVIATHFLI